MLSFRSISSRFAMSRFFEAPLLVQILMGQSIGVLVAPPQPRFQEAYGGAKETFVCRIAAAATDLRLTVAEIATKTLRDLA